MSLCQYFWLFVTGSECLCLSVYVWPIVYVPFFICAFVSMYVHVPVCMCTCLCMFPFSIHFPRVSSFLCVFVSISLYPSVCLCLLYVCVPRNWFLVLSPMRLMTIFDSLTALGAFRPLTSKPPILLSGWVAHSACECAWERKRERVGGHLRCLPPCVHECHCVGLAASVRVSVCVHVNAYTHTHMHTHTHTHTPLPLLRIYLHVPFIHIAH
jgi:hypothetical protein